jgi:hypothetical protein
MSQPRKWERDKAAGLSVCLHKEGEKDGSAVVARTCSPQTEKKTAGKWREIARMYHQAD